jgi:predicted deacylase
MQRIDHPLPGQSLGQHTTVSSFHFGAPGARPKAYIQASLHAEEIPAMLVAHHLRGLLEAAERQGRLRGQVVLVPVANPIGLAQRVDHKPMGRFELDSSENFNRHYPNLANAVFAEVRGTLGPDADANVASVRAAVGRYLHNWKPANALQGLRKTLAGLAFDADLVLDLHCDCEAELHLYTEDACWPRIEPLARLLGVRAALLASDTGASSFDECFSGLWWQLSARLAAGAAPGAAPTPLPQACASTTVELRGEADVTHALALRDAHAILAYLQHEGILTGDQPVALPAPACVATPLAGSQTVKAGAAGVLVFRAAVGDTLAVGDAVADIIDPLADSTVTVRAEVAGVLYARTYDRYVLPHDDLANIAGSVAFRTGNLLGA